jgi:hypothetical protein
MCGLSSLITGPTSQARRVASFRGRERGAIASSRFLEAALGSALTAIEQIPLPDVQRPAKLTSLPQWLEDRCKLLKMEMVPGPTGRYQRAVVLPKTMLLNERQLGPITKHAAALDRVLAMTPEQDIRHGKQTMAAVGKMMLVLPAKESGEIATEAKSEAYMAALDDVPFWAVQEAMRRWYRGEYGPKYDYRWQPPPATLRELALIEAFHVQAVRRQLHQVIVAVPEVEFGEDHCRRMRAKMDELGLGFRPKNEDAA